MGDFLKTGQNHLQKPMASDISVPLFNHPLVPICRNYVKWCQKLLEMHNLFFSFGSIVDAPCIQRSINDFDVNHGRDDLQNGKEATSLLFASSAQQF